jgi:hypothetical protein
MLNAHNMQTDATSGLGIRTDIKSRAGGQIHGNTAPIVQRRAAIMAAGRTLPIPAGLLLSLGLAVAGIGPGLSTARVNATAQMAAPRPAIEDQNPKIAPPDSHSHGRTYGEWAAAWWQWALSIPADRNSFNDPDGHLCGEGQSGPVWFAEAAGPGAVERVCRMPAGKAIFMPVYNWIFGAGVFDCDPSVPGVQCDVELLRQNAAANTVKAEETGGILEVIIDGKRVQNVKQYRAQSPTTFCLTYPENSLLGLPAGVYCPQVTDGYWLLVEPLSAGEHTIKTYVLAPDTPAAGTLEFSSTTHIIVGQ